MKLSELFEGIDIKHTLNFRDVEPTGISTDSRSMRGGELFAAVRGHSVDGHDFIGEAVDRGASALVVDRVISSTLPSIVVGDTAVAAALLAKNFFGDPTSRLTLVGITGTNGKTSTSFLMNSIMNKAIGPAGIIGTVGFGSAGNFTAATHTTPASIDLYRIIVDFLERGCKAVVMEVSSHAASQNRIKGLEFDAGIFTNITRDHLDYHGTFDRYILAKESFAGTLVEKGRKKKPGILVYNLDDPRLVQLAARFTGKGISFGIFSDAVVRAEGLRADLGGTHFELVIGDERASVQLKLLGTFSAYNALAAAAAAHALGIGLDEIKEGLEEVREVPGRFQVISAGAGPTVIVDYAHTPDALENLLRFCRELPLERILTVFGCGGDRDRGKRPLMGKIAAAMSDAVYITDDNPRTEDPDRIVDEILQGLRDSQTPVQVLRDRREAIRKAVIDAESGDLVVIAGKGHESVQILKTDRVPFNDADEAKEALRIAEVGYQG